MAISLLNKENTGLIIVDVQEKLMQVMDNPDRVTDRIVKLLHLSRVFKLPVILTEQYSKWLGPTLPPIKESLPEYDPIEKLDFNSCSVDLYLAIPLACWEALLVLTSRCQAIPLKSYRGYPAL